MGQWVLISEGPYKLPGWVVSLMARRPYKVAAVALANKMARICYATLRDHEPYGPAKLERKLQHTAFKRAA